MISLLKQLVCDRGRRVFLASALLLSLSANVFAAGVGSVCFKEICFNPEIARAQIEKQQGLMGREKLSENGGMLFVYERESSPAFWMKDMLIPLDFIWFDASGKTIKLDQNIPACPQSGSCPAIGSSKPAKYILEVSAGSIQKTGIKIGDQAIIKLGEKNAEK